MEVNNTVNELGVARRRASEKPGLGEAVGSGSAGGDGGLSLPGGCAGWAVLAQGGGDSRDLGS